MENVAIHRGECCRVDIHRARGSNKNWYIEWLIKNEEKFIAKHPKRHHFAQSSIDLIIIKYYPVI